MFTRGETQAIAVVTLGGDADAQRIDELTGVGKSRRFYLNYFFPPSCVGEVGSPHRGAVHAAWLAAADARLLRRRAAWVAHRVVSWGTATWRSARCCPRCLPPMTCAALRCVCAVARAAPDAPCCLGLPAQFPYAIRLESTITESNGSSSMATVCAGCLALQDAGVPVTRPVAGVAMGLVLPDEPGQEAIVLTDILGSEDALGDMDFKVAGARRRASDWLR